MASLKSKSPLLAMAALTLLFLALALPGIRSMPVTDRDEARYAQASKQMAESGNYVQIRFLDEARNKKPAGIYWLHTLSVRLTGIKDQIWPYRLVSVFGALLVVWLVYLLARRLQPDSPLLPAVVLAACPLLVIVAHAATTDAVLAATVCAAQLCLANVYLARPDGRKNADTNGGFWNGWARKAEIFVMFLWFAGEVTAKLAFFIFLPKLGGGMAHQLVSTIGTVGAVVAEAGMVLCFLLAIAWVIATLIGLTGEWFAVGFWIVLGIGILVKGPVTPLITGLTILALCLHDRNYRWLRVLRPGFGFGLMVLIVLPWLLAIQHATHGEFLRESLGHDFGAKLQGTQESHGAPPGAYLAAAGLLLWPLFPLAWRGIGRAWQARRSDPAAAFLLAWLIPSWLVFELAPTKLPHYVLPLYPALVFLALRKAGAADKPASRFWRFTCRIADFIWWVAAVLLVAGPPLAARLLGWQWLPAAFACSVVAGVAALFAWRLRQRPAALAAVAAGFALLYFPLLFASVLPRLDDLWLTRKVAALVAQETRGKPTHILSLGFNEPSVAFVFGTQTRFAASPEAAIQALAQDPEALVLVQDAPAALPQLLPVGEVAWAKLTAAIAVAPKHLNRQAFLDAAARAGVTVREAGFADGLNYSRTKRVRVILYRGAGCRMRGAE